MTDNPPPDVREPCSGCIEVVQRLIERGLVHFTDSGIVFDPDIHNTPSQALLNAYAEIGRQHSLIEQAFEAINSGRSEPLFIMRDALRNHLEDRAALKEGN